MIASRSFATLAASSGLIATLALTGCAAASDPTQPGGGGIGQSSEASATPGESSSEGVQPSGEPASSEDIAAIEKSFETSFTGEYLFETEQDGVLLSFITRLPEPDYLVNGGPMAVQFVPSTDGTSFTFYAYVSTGDSDSPAVDSPWAEANLVRSGDLFTWNYAGIGYQARIDGQGRVASFAYTADGSTTKNLVSYGDAAEKKFGKQFLQEVLAAVKGSGGTLSATGTVTSDFKNWQLDG